MNSTLQTPPYDFGRKEVTPAVFSFPSYDTDNTVIHMLLAVCRMLAFGA